jgi:integrase
MGRKPTANSNLPPRMRARVQRSGVTYYYYDTGAKPRREIPLGSSYVEAVIKWGELEGTHTVGNNSEVTFAFVADRYTREVVPAKAPRTQRDNVRELVYLREFFDGAPINEIRPIHVRQYLDWRPAKTRANREVALLSHVFNLAREWGYTDNINPCAGVRRNKEAGREVYVDDALLSKILANADEPLRDALELAYLTGQRPADVLKMDERDIKDGALWIKQNKTAAKLRIEVRGQLAELVQRIMKRKATFTVRVTRVIINEHGQPLDRDALRYRLDKAREAAGVAKGDFQFRDMRSKAGTDTEENSGMEAAKNQLGHANESMTRQYVRHKKGKLVGPTK